MNRLHVLIISLFVVALGTGVVVGMGVTRALPGLRTGPRDGRSWLADQLNLSPAQSDQMKTIWEDVRGASKPRNDARAQYRKERDDALQALLTPEQKAAYAKATDHYNAEIAELNRQQEAEFQGAAERTKKILNDRQRAIYEDLLKKGFRGGPGRPGGPGGPSGGPGGHGGHGPGHGPGPGPDGGPGHGHGSGEFDGMHGGPTTTSRPG